MFFEHCVAPAAAEAASEDLHAREVQDGLARTALLRAAVHNASVTSGTHCDGGVAVTSKGFQSNKKYALHTPSQSRAKDLGTCSCRQFLQRELIQTEGKAAVLGRVSGRSSFSEKFQGGFPRFFGSFGVHFSSLEGTSCNETGGSVDFQGRKWILPLHTACEVKRGKVPEGMPEGNQELPACLCHDGLKGTVRCQSFLCGLFALSVFLL